MQDIFFFSRNNFGTLFSLFWEISQHFSPKNKENMVYARINTHSKKPGKNNTAIKCL